MKDLANGLTKQDILIHNSGTRCYTNLNTLNATLVYRFRYIR